MGFMDIRIVSVIISATVAILIAILNHFIITPIKDRRNRKREQLKNFYAPFYGLVTARINSIKPYIVTQGRIMLGGKSDSSWLNSEYMDKLFIEKAGYASNDLIEAWVNYSSVLQGTQNATPFVNQLVKEYNQIKKDLKLPYDKTELKTGIPKILKDVKLSE